MGAERDPEPVSIHGGPVASELPGRTVRGGLCEVAPGKFLLRMDGVARYLVSGGSRITIDAAPGADEDSVRLFLLGPVFGALLLQRGLLPFHASAIGTPKGAVLFMGASGVGKSALVAAFHARGYRAIADEVCAIRVSAAGAEALPAVPRLLLWPDAIEQTGLWGPNVRPARPNLRKYQVPLEKGFAAAPSPVHAVYVLSMTNMDKSSLSRVAGLNRFQRLAEFTSGARFVAGMCAENDYFKRVTALAGAVRISRLERSFSLPLRETADLLEEDFSR